MASVEVLRIVMDFEYGEWGAFYSVFPGVSITGCCFHWTQAVWKRVQEYGLVPAYCQKKNTSKFIRELLCLPFLPHEQIYATFKDFCDLIEPSHPEGLQKLMKYIEDNWMEGKPFSPVNWSVFKIPIRTNSDHLNRLCDKLGHNNVNLYELIEILHKESQFLTVQCQLVSQEKLQRYQRQKYKEYQQKIFLLWEDFEGKRLTPRSLLQQAIKLFRCKSSFAVPQRTSLLIIEMYSETTLKESCQ